jgi:hypothetical protein
MTWRNVPVGMVQSAYLGDDKLRNQEIYSGATESILEHVTHTMLASVTSYALC